MTASKPRIVVTHWVHPEVAGYLAGFSDALIPSPEECVYPPERVADLTVVPDTIIAPTAELAIGLAIGLMRNVAAGDARIRRGDFAGWRPQLYGAGLSGSTVGIAGMGQLGQAIARRLAEISDVLIAALPLTSRTRYLIGSDLIRRLQPGAFLVNVGRGSVADEDAIADALDSGHLGGFTSPPRRAGRGQAGRCSRPIAKLVSRSISGLMSNLM